MIDLRSDTVTRPSQGMRQAMYEAEVGDDVYGEDPTVNRLQERVAAVLGKEAALFVPSGTMANQICLHVLTDPGDEVLLERGSHVFNYESGAAGLLSGIQLHPLDGDRGRLSPSQVDAAVRPAADVLPRTRVVSVENTANKAGGVVYSPDRIQSIAEVARAHDLHLHLDGARLWNAAAALEVEEQALAAPADLVWVALSKGLGAPVGSVIAGPSPLIDTARRTRKQFGGGMRQAGILAAAGLYAIEHHRPALDRDHEKAHRLAEGIAACPQFSVDPAEVDTNIVIFEGPADRAADIVEDLQEDDVLLTPFGPSTIRATTHRDVSMDETEEALSIIQAYADRQPAPAPSQSVGGSLRNDPRPLKLLRLGLILEASPVVAVGMEVQPLDPVDDGSDGGEVLPPLRHVVLCDRLRFDGLLEPIVGLVEGRSRCGRTRIHGERLRRLAFPQAHRHVIVQVDGASPV